MGTMMVIQDSNQSLDHHMYEDLDLESPDGEKNKKKNLGSKWKREQMKNKGKKKKR